MSLVEDVRTRLLSKSYEMPTLPHVATQALALAQDEDSTAVQLSDLICQDQALAANLLRMANSPAFRGASAIVSLQQAITRLGMRTITELAVTICVKGSIFPKDSFSALSEELWAHSLASALFAKEVARQQRRNVEAAYLCGLLHRIGMPIVLKAIDEVCDKSNRPSEQEVRATLEALHQDVGLQASKLWNLPSQVLATIRYWKQYDLAQQHQHVAAVVHLSSLLATSLLAQQGFEEASDLPVLEALSMYPDHLAGIVNHQDEIIAVIAS